MTNGIATSKVEEIFNIKTVEQIDETISKLKRNKKLITVLLTIAGILLIPIGLLMFVMPGLIFGGLIFVLLRAAGNIYHLEMNTLLQRRLELVEEGKAV